MRPILLRAPKGFSLNPTTNFSGRMTFKHLPLASAALCLTVAFAGCSSGNRLVRQYEEDPSTVAVIRGTPVSLQEFERQYAKTVGGRAEAATDSLAEYQDFLVRWVDFRLKVMAARESGLDRDSALVAEMDTYREQFARPFLLDREVTDPLIRDLYERRQKMVDASHILIRVNPDSAPADTLRAYEKLSSIRDSVLAGADFGEMALRYSEDPSASAAAQGPGYRGRLGFVRGGRLVPEFEDVAFSIPEGDVSRVFRTQFGYHILEVHERKPAVQDIRISHIMVTPESPEDSAAAWQEVQAVKDSLDAGIDFAELARRNSDDRGSARNGGDLGFVAIDSRLVPVIKEAAFALEGVGDYTGPIETQFGIHLVQLTGRKPEQTFDDAYNDLRRQVSRSPQMKAREEAFAREILGDYGFTMDTVAVASFFGDLAADSASALVTSGSIMADTPEATIAGVGDAAYSHSDFLGWSRTNPVKQYSDLTDFVHRLIEGFLLDKAVEYKLSRLENENEEFRQTMEDFVDGLLLFRIMDDSVWTKAATDSLELRRRYDADPSRFVYPDRFRLVGIYARTKAAADSVARLLDSGTDIGELSEIFPDTSSTRVRIDTTFVEGPTNSVFDNALELEEGDRTAALAYNRGFIVIVHSGIEPSRTKTFEEARTEIVSEYQEDLEDELIARLRKRYGAVTYPEKVSVAFGTGDDDPVVTSAASN